MLLLRETWWRDPASPALRRGQYSPLPSPTTRDPAELSRCLDIDCQSGCSECEPLQVGPNFPNNNLLVAAAWKRFGALRQEVCKKLSSAGWLWHCSRAARAGRAALYCENWCAKPTLRGARVVLQDWCLL